MTTHEWFAEQCTPFTIHRLDAEAERNFREHLRGCEECQAEIAEIQQDLAWLSTGVWPRNPRPALASALAERALDRKPRCPPWALPVAVAAGIVLLLGAWMWTGFSRASLRSSMVEERAALLNQVSSTRDTLDIIRAAGRVRHADIIVGDRQGGLVIFADDRTQRWNVVVYGLPAPNPGEVRQFWFVTETGMVKGVEVKTDGTAPTFLTLGMPRSGGRVKGAALTVEVAGSDGPQPMGPELAHLEM
jgi:hypothetical protein